MTFVLNSKDERNEELIILNDSKKEKKTARVGKQGRIEHHKSCVAW